MLRCLGWNKTQIIFIIIMKVTLFYIIPGAFFGILLSKFSIDEVKS